jgi:Ca-activated chloride channel family protein
MSHTGKINKSLIISIVIIASALLITACSAPAEKLNQEGNQAFAEQAYLEALELYQSAQVESPELAQPYFNAANTLYRQGDFPAALEQMQMALQYVDEESLAESSLFNLGNTLYNSQDLNQAVNAYTQALLLDPEDQDAKYNLELALQQQEQQEQEQNQEQQDDSQDEEQDQSEEQSGEGDQSENEQEGEQGDQSQDSENQDQENQNEQGDQSQENDAQNEEQQDQGNGQPEPDEQSQDGDQPSQMPPPGQRMTEEQARQLLAALANNMETLQEHLGQDLFAGQAPPVQDW